MKFSHFGISGGVHLAVLGLIVFGAFEVIDQASAPLPSAPAPVMDVLGGAAPGGGQPLRETGPVIKTPRIKIPVYTYEEPVAQSPEPPPPRPTQALPTTAVPLNPAKVKPAEQAGQQRKPTVGKPSGPEHKWVSVDTKEILQGGGIKTGGGAGTGTSVGGDPEASFDQVLLGEIRRLLLKYKAGRGALQAYVSFTVAADGRLQNAALRTSSGDTGFDAACLEAVRRVVLSRVPGEFVGRLYSVVIRSED